MHLHDIRLKDDRAFVGVSSFAFALLLVLVLSTPFVEMSGTLSEVQKTHRLYAYGAVGLLQIALIAMRGWQRSLRIVNTPISLFFVWCILSLVWTQHFDLTGKRLVLLGLVYCGIFAGVCDLSAGRSLGIVRIVLGVALILNIVIAIAVPDVGTHTVGGLHLWRGAMGHKNIAGMLCAITAIVFVFAGGKIPAMGRIAALATTLSFLYMAWSKTAWISLPVAVAAGGGIALIGARASSFLEEWRRPASIVSLGLLGVVLVGLISATLQQDFFLSLTNDTTALTTRGAIWRPMIQFYLDHPLFGSGYGAYWDASATSVDTHARNASMWRNVDQGHNGYLDLLVQLGLPGLALALYAAFVSPVGQLTAMIGRNPQRAALISALLIFSLFENLSESSLFADDTIGNAFLLLALGYAHRFALQSSKRFDRGEKAGLVSALQLRDSRQKRSRGANEA